MARLAPTCPAGLAFAAHLGADLRVSAVRPRPDGRRLTPTAAVIARLAGGAVALAVVATVVRLRWFAEARRHAPHRRPLRPDPDRWRSASATTTLSPTCRWAWPCCWNTPRLILVVGWIWLTTRRWPSAHRDAGWGCCWPSSESCCSTSSAPNRPGECHRGVVGVAAAVCAVCYFMMSDTGAGNADQESLHPLTLATGGCSSAAPRSPFGLTGIMPLAFGTADVTVAGVTAPWFAAVVVSACSAPLSPTPRYQRGGPAAARLRLLVGLSEVLFAVVLGLAADRRGDDTGSGGDRRGGEAPARAGAARPGCAFRRAHPGPTAAPVAAAAAVADPGVSTPHRFRVAPTPTAVRTSRSSVRGTTAEPVGIGCGAPPSSTTCGTRVGGRTVGTYAVNYLATFDFWPRTAPTTPAPTSSRCGQLPEHPDLVLGGLQGAVIDVISELPSRGRIHCQPLPADALITSRAIALFSNPSGLAGLLLTMSPEWGNRPIDLAPARRRVPAPAHQRRGAQHLPESGQTTMAADFAAARV